MLVRVDFNVPTEERDGDHRHYRRHADARKSADDQLPARAGREDDLDGAFRPAERKTGGKIFAPPSRRRIHNLINHPVAFSHDCIGADAEKIVADMKDGDVTLLENVRFHAGEEANDPNVCRIARQA